MGGTDIPVCAGTDEWAFCCTDRNVCATRKSSLDGALGAIQPASVATVAPKITRPLARRSRSRTDYQHCLYNTPGTVAQDVCSVPPSSMASDKSLFRLDVPYLALIAFCGDYCQSVIPTPDVYYTENSAMRDPSSLYPAHRFLNHTSPYLAPVSRPFFGDGSARETCATPANP